MRLLRILTISLVIFFIAGTILAIMPPGEIAKINLEAQLILIGEVAETAKVMRPEKTSTTKQLKGIFVLKVLHVVKGFGTVSPGDQVKILFRIAPKGAIGASVKLTGGPLVKVKAGNLVVVYIDPSNHPGFNEPVAAGSSVIIIDRSMLENDPADEKKREE